MVAVAIVMQFWVTVNNAGKSLPCSFYKISSLTCIVWITIFGLFIFLTNLYLVRLYGEIEFGFSILKILLIVVRPMVSISLVIA